jgi:hypothetical protein
MWTVAFHRCRIDEHYVVEVAGRHASGQSTISYAGGSLRAPATTSAMDKTDLGLILSALGLAASLGPRCACVVPAAVTVRRMPTRLQLEAARVADRIERGDAYWPAQLAVAATIVIGFAQPERVSPGPSWMLPAVEAVLLVALAAVTPARATDHSAPRRRFTLTVIGTVTLANAVSLGLLVYHLVGGEAAGGRELVASGAGLWTTNVLLFAVWYWQLDRGGPEERFLVPDAPADLQFPQMANPELAPAGWRPGFTDYLYTSLTNATAFSPTDTMPLTHTAKTIMGIQSVTALLTLALVVARAVNILG